MILFSRFTGYLSYLDRLTAPDVRSELILLAFLHYIVEL